jgi:hypothetical protein
MGTLYLVRHGQASFGEDDYDQLSRWATSRACAWANTSRQGPARSTRWSPARCAATPRHLPASARAWAGIALALQWPGLNEYDSEAVIATIHPHKLEKPDLARDVPPPFPAAARRPDPVDERRGQPARHAQLRRLRTAGVTSALDHVRKQHHGSNVLLVSSGGPISTAVGHVLGTSPETTIELNLRIRNSSVTEFASTPSGTCW